MSAGEYGEPFLDLDTALFREYNRGEEGLPDVSGVVRRANLVLRDRRVKPGDRVIVSSRRRWSAIVTVFDLTSEQLERDRAAADHYGYEVETIQGDMRDLSVFEDDSFSWLHRCWNESPTA